MPPKVEELLKRMSTYKRQYHATLGQLQETKRTNANLNERVTKAEAKIERQSKLIERLEEEHLMLDDPALDLELPNTIDEDEPESSAPWVFEDEEDHWLGSDFYSDDDWYDSDNSEEDGW